MASRRLSDCKPMIANIIAGSVGAAGTTYLDVTGSGFLMSLKNYSAYTRVEIDGQLIFPSTITDGFKFMGTSSSCPLIPFMWKFNSRLKISTSSTTDITVQYTLE